MAKKDKRINLQTITTIYLGFIAIVISFMVSIIQEIYRQLSPSIISLLVMLTVCFLAFCYIIYSYEKITLKS